MPAPVDPAAKERIQAAVKKARENLLQRLEDDEVKHQQTTKQARQQLIASLKAKPDKTPQLLRLIEKLEVEEEKSEQRPSAAPAVQAPQQPHQDGLRLRDTFAMHQGFNAPPVRPNLPKLNTFIGNTTAASPGPDSHHETDAAASNTGHWPLAVAPVPPSAIHPALRPQATERDGDAGTRLASKLALLDAKDAPARAPAPPPSVRVAPPQASAERPFASLYRTGRLAAPRDGRLGDGDDAAAEESGGGGAPDFRVDAARRMQIHDELMACLEQYWQGVRDVGQRKGATVRAAVRDVLGTVERVAMQDCGFDTPEGLNGFLFEEPQAGEEREVSVRREEVKVKLAFAVAWVERAEWEGW